MRALWLLFFSLCSLACADVPPPPPKVGKPSPSQSSGAWRPLPDSEGWRRFRTDHFELMTDLPEPLALEASVALERTRTALLQALWSQLAPSGQTQRVRVVVLGEVPEFVHYFGNGVSGMNVTVNRALIVLRGSPKHWERLYRGGKFSTSILRHELAHDLAAGIYGRQPRWFAEGLAQFLEAVVIERDSDIALVGRPKLEDEAQHEFSTALALEPGHPDALRLWRSFHGMSKEKVLERLSDQVRSRPDDGEAWLLLGSLLEGDEREASLRRAVALLGDEARGYNELAWYLVEHGRGEEALPMAAKAAGLAPRDAAVLDTYAASLFSTGRCPDALQVQLRAIDNLPEDDSRSPQWMSHFPEVLARYRAACGTVGAAP